MKLNLTIQMDNEAFSPEPEVEVARILHALADRCGQNLGIVGYERAVLDVNGNKVGTVKITR